jgi:GH15 family glucan-1,4-alpha-glucosidase
MAKSIMLGNGSLLVGLDYAGLVRDLYFHYAGLENHVGHNLVHKIGVYVDDQFSWIDDGTWDIVVGCEKETMASLITAKKAQLGIEMRFSDVVYNEKNIFIRQIVIKNNFERNRKVKIFFNQQFNIAQIHSGDTAYFDPLDNVVIHYKGRRVFLVNARSGRLGIDDYCVGLLGIEGREGTYKDAEDGILSKNPIEHGQVDSVISLTIDVEAKGEEELYYWLIAAKSIKKAKELNEEVVIRGPLAIMTTTKNYWHAWVNLPKVDFSRVDKRISDLYKESLIYIRTHVNKNGSIIASGDSDMLQFGRDYYEYMWPRDGAFTALCLIEAGDFNASKRFFEFCNEVLTEKGYFMHKYRPDKSLGSSWHPWVVDGEEQLPIQEDETAIVICVLWRYFELSHDLEFIESIYNSFIRKAAEFMLNYRDEKTGLPKASYDLWEMYYGISTYTASSVYAALLASAKFATMLGKEIHAKSYTEAAETIQKGILKYLYDEKSGVFYKYIQTGKKEKYIEKSLDFSSVFGVFTFGVMAKDDKKLKKAFDLYEDRLMLKGSVGGVARFEGDIYLHKGGDYPGNPWIVTSLWLAQYRIATAAKKEELREAEKMILWVVEHAAPSGILPEQIDPLTGEHLSATPLVWSHAEFARTVTLYLNKFKELQ